MHFGMNKCRFITDRPFLEGNFIMKKKQQTDNPVTPQLAIVTWLDAFDGPTGVVETIEVNAPTPRLVSAATL